MNFNKIYLKFFTRQNISFQLLSIFIFAIFLPVTSLGIFVYSFARGEIMKNYEILTVSEANRIRSILLTTTMPLYDISLSFLQDADLKQLLSTEYKSDGEALSACAAFDKFSDVFARNPSLSQVRLYADKDLLRGVTDQQHFFSIDDEIKKKDWYQRSLVTAGSFWQTSFRTDRFKNQFWELAYYVRIPNLKNNSSAVLEMTISDNYLHNLIHNSNSDVYVSVNQDPLFYATNRQYAGSGFPAELDYRLTSFNYTGKLKIDQKKSVSTIVTLTPYRTSDRIYILTADMSAIPYLNKISLAFALIMLFAILIPAGIIFVFTGYFSARVHTLRLAMYKASNNDYQIVDSVQGDDELSNAFADLKHMIEKIKKAEATVYEVQIREQYFSNQQQKMELKLLASQINPHFLYNTLETIRMKAFSEGNHEVANAIKLLGKSMRYVLNNTKTTATTLDKEVDYIQTYLSILKLRFGNRLNYSIQVDPSILLSHYKVLPLLLQPIVENAVLHGIEETGQEGFILIQIKKLENNVLSARVFDNGAGMTKQKLNEVRRKIESPSLQDNQGIGLYNINNRIKLFYGQQYGLSIKSCFNRGTLVTWRIPLNNLWEEKK